MKILFNKKEYENMFKFCENNFLTKLILHVVCDDVWGREE